MVFTTHLTKAAHATLLRSFLGGKATCLNRRLKDALIPGPICMENICTYSVCTILRILMMYYAQLSAALAWGRPANLQAFSATGVCMVLKGSGSDLLYGLLCPLTREQHVYILI